MIPANELRIGSKFHGIAGEQTVFAIHDNTNRGQFNQKGYEHLILVKENGNQYKPCEIDGIPLTPEILERCGFIKEDRTNCPAFQLYLGKNNYLICNHNDDEIYIDKPNVDDDHFPDFTVIPKNCKYLHQLQSLYFALDGEELIIAPNDQRSVATDAK